MPQEPFKFDPFGGLAVIGAAHDLLLQRLCYCYHTADPKTSRESYGLSQAAAFLEGSRPVPEGRTRWWRNKKDGRTTYLCLDPRRPGYRETLPTEPGVWIEDIPVEMGLSILPTMAKTTLDVRGKHRTPDERDVQHVLEGLSCASTRHVARDVQGFVAKMERYSTGIQRGQYKSREAMEEAINQIYQEGLFEVSVDCVQFSASIGVFELQAEMNQWIQQRVYLKPQDFFRTFIERLASEQALVSVGHHHFTTGRDKIATALKKGCFWKFQEQVYLALHHFWIAHIIAMHAKVKLPYSRMVAEESLVCANSGLACGLGLFFDRSPIDVGKDLARCLERGDERPVEKFLHEHCSPFFPVIPRPFAQMIIEFAHILARPAGGGKESDLEPIFASDRALGDTHHTSALFSSFTRDCFLLNAAKHLGLEDAAQRYATSIMGRLIVDRKLS